MRERERERRQKGRRDGPSCPGKWLEMKGLLPLARMKVTLCGPTAWQVVPAPTTSITASTHFLLHPKQPLVCATRKKGDGGATSSSPCRAPPMHPASAACDLCPLPRLLLQLLARSTVWFARSALNPTPMARSTSLPIHILLDGITILAGTATLLIPLHTSIAVRHTTELKSTRARQRCSKSASNTASNRHREVRGWH
jgi:hypothetical protein